MKEKKIEVVVVLPPKDKTKMVKSLPAKPKTRADVYKSSCCVKKKVEKM